MQPTTEQQAALEAFATGDDVVITAGAGTGKTSTLRLLAESTPAAGVYLAFNRSIADEAKSKFPRRVQARTAHSFAAGRARRDPTGSNVLARLNERPPFQGVVDLLDLEPMQVVTAGGQRTFSTWDVGRWVQNWVRTYCQSADEDLGVEHFPAVPGIVDERVRAAVAAELLPAAHRAWADMTAARGACRVGHEVYLKLWQMSGPTLPGDFILFDEAQDASPVMATVVSAQETQKVYVGDESQAIYRFTGARDAMRDLAAAHRVKLTQSWRFGPVIADAANTVLDILDSDLLLTGAPGRDSRLFDGCPTPTAVLCRNNATTIAEIIAAQHAGGATHLLGGTRDALAFVGGAEQLMERGSSSHPELAWFSSWAQAQEYAEEDPHGGEIATLVHLVDTYGTDILTRALQACVSSEDRADLTVSTAHKAKGREWDAVDLADDFDLTESVDEIHSPGEAGALARDELMLAYVAITRARFALGADPLVEAFGEHGLPPLEQAMAGHSPEPDHLLTVREGARTDRVHVRGRTIEIEESTWAQLTLRIGVVDAEQLVAGELSDMLDEVLDPTPPAEAALYPQPRPRSDPSIADDPVDSGSARVAAPVELYEADEVLGHERAQQVRAALLAAVATVRPTHDDDRVFGSIAAALHGLGLSLARRPRQRGYSILAGEDRLTGSALGPDFTGPALVKLATAVPDTEAGLDRG